MVPGAELPLPLSPKQSAVLVVARWTALAWGAAAPSTTFMLDGYINGPRIEVAVLPFPPRAADVIRTAAERENANRPRPRTAWMTIAALVGLAVADPAARAFAVVSSLYRPVEYPADALCALTGRRQAR